MDERFMDHLLMVSALAKNCECIKKPLPFTESGYSKKKLCYFLYHHFCISLVEMRSGFDAFEIYFTTICIAI
jgi:hypothetical protein